MARAAFNVYSTKTASPGSWLGGVRNTDYLFVPHFLEKAMKSRIGGIAVADRS